MLLSLLLFNPSAQNGPWSLTNSTIGIRDRLARYLGIQGFYLSKRSSFELVQLKSFDDRL
jgi:hypothetical protein